MAMNENELDLTTELLHPVWLAVKYTNPKAYNGQSWCNYIIPIERKDGTKRCYGDLYTYFTNNKDFRFAIGYYLEESECTMYWKAQNQTFYFAANRTPYLTGKRLEKPLLQLKRELKGR